jgi:ABC-2 type transport system permease protein
MRHFIVLLRHELRMLLIAPATYVAAVLFFILMGFLYWAILRAMVEKPEDVLPSVQFFSIFWIPVFFVVPLLTMRSIAGERANGTLDTLLTTPASRFAIVASKFGAAYVFYMLLWIATLWFPFITDKLFPHAMPDGGLLNPATHWGGFLFVGVSGMLFIAVGIFSSSLTRSQLVAGMLTFTALFLIVVGGQQLGGLARVEGEWAQWLKGAASYFQLFQHLDDFARGVIDTRPFVYYLSTAALLLGLSSLILEAKA